MQGSAWEVKCLVLQRMNGKGEIREGTRRSEVWTQNVELGTGEIVF